MSQPVKCLDCGVDFDVNYECCNELSNTPMENEEDITKKIKEIEELTNFNVKKNICLNCLDKLIKERESTNQFLLSEKDLLTMALENLMTEIESKDFVNVINYSDEELTNKEEEVSKQLENLKEKEKRCEEELKKLTDELKSITEEENKYWEEFNSLERNIYLYEKSKAFTKTKINYYEKEIKNFSNTNIFSDLFNISFSDKYGTINGSRMGALLGNNILYDEINSGWGYILFLTTIIARKFNYDFKKFELVPMGNYSKIINKNNKATYELTLANNVKSLERFNEGMLIYLENLRELNDFLMPNLINSIKSTSDFNYKIQTETINNYSIKFDTNNPEGWNQCMKYLLTILKLYINGVLKKEDEEYKNILEKSNLINNK
jgi:beclin 1